MKKIKSKHKQSKYFTIMLIPESSAKVRRLHIPYWLLSVLGIPFICLLVIVVLFQTRVVNLENLLDHSSLRLSETIDEKGRLRESLLSSDAPSISIAPQMVIEPLAEPDDSNEAKMAEILARLDTIDGMKQGIITVFKDLAALEALPFLFDENTLSGGIIRAQGGAYAGGPEDIIAELDVILSDEVVDLQALVVLAEDIEAYFRARPVGWPVTSRNVGSEFGFRLNPFTGRGLEMHEGIDISVPVGTRVYATAYGVVSFAGWNTGGFGYLVTIEHDYDYSTYYAHNSSVLVSEGDEVARGQLIALSGNTGRSTSPHCHYEVRNNGIPVNPRGYLE